MPRHLGAPVAARGSRGRFQHRGRRPFIRLVREGKFVAEDYGVYSAMKHKGSELAPLGTFEKKIPAAVVAKVKAKEKAIVDGSFVVKIDDSQPKSTAK